ncbi:putative bifunctional diguanylate cyclase/phosphodiesterase [Sphingomonas sp. URHD0057]|uniref:putative bifunctional diguanylate cyclase/phosphodiesterase n=1 Tax=Sphingomonas sp. URHD0057 TaxID=1380389 RepID=UPI0006865775|nr:EAL domain-containing protein [Sphingomonas sp. URHD0057]
MHGASRNAVRIASSHLITSCATIAALLLFVGLGSQVLPGALRGAPVPDANSTLTVAFLLNIAIILFGWRRSKDLKEALEAYEESERAAHRNANTDPATGLSNRRELLRCLTEARETKTSGALLLLDLDHFKRVNDLHGHLAGDQLLAVFAETLTRAAPAAACCARIGGDEFAVLLANSTAVGAERVARAIIAQLAAPVLLGGSQVQVSASIGLAELARGQSEEDILRQSDVALYAAKRAGRNCLAWFDEELERELTERLKLEEDIRAGVRLGEFVPFFQPLIDLQTRELVGFEALARWRSPTRGFVEAEAFIEVAEATGLVGPLTLAVMETALREARVWPQHLKIAVNISPVQFRDASLAEQIMKVLAATGFPAHRLEIEITEGSLLEDRDQFTTIIQSLKNVGISISLDDFGTGYASLAQLHTLPVDRIKIDKSFIATLVKSEQTAAIVATIAQLGHTLNVPITAEGVESESIRNELQKFGCSEAQGWLFGRAVSAETVRTFLDMSEKGAASEASAPESPTADDSADDARFTPRIRRRPA